MYLADYHTHSATSPDGQLTVSELAEAAVRAGLDEICVTDHVDTVLWGDHRPREHFDWSRLLRELPEARETYTGRLAIRLGAELGEAPMGFDRAEKLLGEAPKLDFVIGSVHMAGEKFKHFDLYYIEKNSETYYHRVIDSYLEDVLRLARWGRFSVLGHLTLPLRYMNENLGEQMTFDGHYDQCREIFRALIESGCGIECNTNRGQRAPAGRAAVEAVPGDGRRDHHHRLGRALRRICRLLRPGNAGAAADVRVPVFLHV